VFSFLQNLIKRFYLEGQKVAEKAPQLPAQDTLFEEAALGQKCMVTHPTNQQLHWIQALLTRESRTDNRAGQTFNAISLL